jgi:signal transduction histidine kinase
MTGQAGVAAYLILGLICLIMPSLTWVILARQRSRVVVLWCSGSLLYAGGMLLVALRGSIPDWASFAVANLVTFAGLLSSIQALRLDQGASWRLRWMVVAGLGYLLSFEFIERGLGNTPLRKEFIILVHLLLLLQVVRWAWHIARRQQSIGALAIAGSHLLLAVAMLVRLVNLIQVGGGGESPLRHLVEMGLLASTAVLAAIVGDVGFISIALERSTRQQLEAVASRVRVDESLRLSNQLAQLDRQRSLGLMAATLAHELNQPLTAILASAQAARRGTAANRLDSDQSLELLDNVILNTRRISGITDRIRSFIRPGEAQSAPVDLVRITREMLELMQPDLRRHGVRVAFPAAGPQVLVQGDAIQLSQVVLNVLRNAIDAVQLVPDRSIQIQILRSDREAVLSISDSGPGLDPELADQFGTPYFTTKDHGLGLGLSISTAILRHHQGSLTLRNAEEGGACVDIRLPLLAGGVP